MLLFFSFSEEMAHVVLYSFGLGSVSTIRLSESIKACSFSYKYSIFKGSASCFVDGSLEEASPEQVYWNVSSLRGPKIVVLLFRQEDTESDARMLTFLTRLTQLFQPASGTKLCVCFPIPSQKNHKSSEAARNQATKLVELAQSSRGRLKALELYATCEHDSVIAIPGISCQAPHYITQGGCYQLAHLIVEEIATKLNRKWF